MNTLKQQRRELFNAVSYCDQESWPGSQEWIDLQAAEEALSEFDAKHPEVLADNQAARSARIKTENPARHEN